MKQASEAATTLTALSNELAGAVERAGSSVVAIYARQRIPSSGILWKKDVVVSADHTIERDEEISITLPDGRSVPAALAGRDPSTDIAVLKLDSGAVHPADAAEPAELRAGNLVLAVGRTSGNNLAASMGVLSAVAGPWRTWRGGHLDQRLRLDLSIFYGFSGSALVDAAGQILGMNTTGLARGAGVGIPAKSVTRVADELLQKGHVARGYLGVGLQPVLLPHSLQQALNLQSNAGAIVISVENESPAAKAGMLIGDIIMALDGSAIRHTGDVEAKLTPDAIGKKITVSLIRAGAAAQLQIQVGERPRPEN